VQIGVVGQLALQLALVAVALDGAAVGHATLIFFLLLARFGVGQIGTVEITSHGESP